MKIIVIEGTDCSGKETQSILLEEKLKEAGYSCARYSFPVYESPSGKIVGGAYLGKDEISKSYFTEGAVNVDARVASLYYAADRLYNIDKMIDENLDFIILDRYVSSNMAHQGSKLENPRERLALYRWLEKLEYDLLKLPQADITFFLHMPYEKAAELKKNRDTSDEHERSEKHLRQAESAYLELAELYDWSSIKCVVNDEIRTKEDIAEEVFSLIKKRKS